MNELTVMVQDIFLMLLAGAAVDVELLMDTVMLKVVSVSSAAAVV
jgi:hypothetical protein